MKRESNLYTLEETWQTIMDKLDKGQHFHFNRYGDGDLYTIIDRSCHSPFKKPALNTISGRHNKFLVTEDYQRELIESYNIVDKNYMISSHTAWKRNSTLAEWVKKDTKANIIANHSKIYYVQVFHDMLVNKPEEFHIFLEKYIRDKKTLLISSTIENNFETVFGKIDFFVETPPTNSYATIDSWYPKVESCLNTEDVDIVFLCTGFSSRILSKRIWELNKNVICLDIGSLYSGLGFKWNRSWYQKHQAQKAYRSIVEKYT